MKRSSKKPTARSSRRGRKTTGKKWSAKVTASSDAMDLKAGIFKSNDPRQIARSVKQSAERSHRRKASPMRSAISMITFYENRGGKNLSAAKRRTLQRAKEELRKEFHRA